MEINFKKIGLVLFSSTILGVWGYSNYLDYQESQKELQYQEKLKQIREKAKADREAKLAAMTQSERSKFLSNEEEQRKKAEIAAEKIREAEKKKKDDEEKAKKFRSELVVKEHYLKIAIKETAFDPDSVVFRDSVYHSNGVCIIANGKNRFGGYVGFKEYCALVDKKGNWKITQ